MHVCIPVFLVFQQLAVSTGQSVTSLTKELQWLLFVDWTENRPLSCTNSLYRHTKEKTIVMLSGRERKKKRQVTYTTR